MNLRALQFFFFAAIALFLSVTILRGALSSGTTYSLSFVDIDGNKLSTADGHVTVLVLATTADWEKARAVGDRVPDYCLGNPDYRHRVNEEARRLQTRYDAKKIARDARTDIFTVTDFDGSGSSQLGEPAGATDFCVFVFGRNGELLAQWHGVPSAKQLAVVVK